MRLKLTEAQVTLQCCDLMKAKGYRCIRLQSGLFSTPYGGRVRIGERGQTDWLFMRCEGFAPGTYNIQLRLGTVRCCFVEVKATGAKPKPEQLAWIDEARKTGFLATWTNDIEEFITWLALNGL